MRNSTVQGSGEYGGVCISNTTPTTGNFQGILITADTVFSAVTSNITSFPTGATIVAGNYIPGVFTSITLTSGTVIAYNRKYA